VDRPNGKFTALMKQLGTLSKEERPAAGNSSTPPRWNSKPRSPPAARNWN